MRRAISVTGFVLLAASAALGATLGSDELVYLAPPIGNNNPGFFVTNDAAHPVPVAPQGTVKVAEQRIPFQKSVNRDDFGTGRFASFFFDVPPGKLLVLESLTVSAVVEVGQRVRGTVRLGGD